MQSASDEVDDADSEGIRNRGRQLAQDLHEFQLSCLDNVAVFGGLGLINYSRRLLVGVWTFLVTFLILANQILHHDTAAAVPPGVGNTTS
ncbi:hypothetical protein BV898_14719 [Hypsibius exemplaris]|uniref:Uncharacterized protein n=1 Tax=Hypsibius exemplaris TaxID=2072580 RepID=A0A9X6RJR5_HYPEX|nr:hypothetical protein BV898_14719 [Hypsibius exemplaris]